MDTTKRVAPQMYVKDIVGLERHPYATIVLLECGHEFVETDDLDDLHVASDWDTQTETSASSYSCAACAFNEPPRGVYLSKEWTAMCSRLRW